MITGPTRSRPAGLLVVAVLLTASCSGGVAGTGRPVPAPSNPVGESCPAVALEPAADRPEIDLRFELDDDGQTVTGTELVTFGPDLATDELVFRLTANQPPSVAAGNGVEIGEVTGDDVEGIAFEAAGADTSTQGGLLVVELARTLAPGERTEVRIDFVLELGEGTFDRFGHDDQHSWWGSGHPLLAWAPGAGWVREPLVDRRGETATSAAAQTTVTVVAPSRLPVLMTGGAELAEDDGRHAQWRSSSPAARDVSVAVGEFEVAEGTSGSTRLVVGTADASASEDLLREAGEAVVALEEYFGPFPFAALSLARLDDYGGGIEYPGMILLADGSDVTLVHEVAHMWFYGMVGDNQARNPWLDEAFATYAEGLVNGTSAERASALQLPLEVGLGIADYPSSEAYFDTVYGKGSAMLDVARREAGADRFDAALRCYVNANAWQIAEPADVEEALRDLPAALEVLREAGAL